MRNTKLEIERDRNGETEILRLSGRVSIENSPGLRGQLRQLLKNGAREILVDLTGLERVDTSGLATLIECAQKLAADGGTLLVSGLRTGITEELSLAQVKGALSTYENEAEALESLKDEPAQKDSTE